MVEEPGVAQAWQLLTALNEQVSDISERLEAVSDRNSGRVPGCARLIDAVS
jgi:hypothetical protein